MNRRIMLAPLGDTFVYSDSMLKLKFSIILLFPYFFTDGPDIELFEEGISVVQRCLNPRIRLWSGSVPFDL